MIVLSKRAVETLKPVALMRLTEVDDPDELLQKHKREDIIVEAKIDGWKLAVIKNDDKIQLFSRRGEEITDNFPQIVKAINIPNGTFCEGEVAYIENNKQDIGKVTSVAGSSAENAEKKIKELKGKFKLFLYDILWLKGKNVSKEPFEKRRKLLSSAVKQNDVVKLTEQYPFDKWQDVYNKALKEGGEGIVLKIKSAPYEYKPAGQNEPRPANTMMKFKGKSGKGVKNQSDDFVVFDYEITDKDSLLAHFGQYFKGKLYEIGKIDNFSKEDAEEIKKKLKKGHFTIEIGFQDRTKNGLRHQKFIRFREDKKAKDATMSAFHAKHINNFELAKKANDMFFISKLAKLEKGDTEKASEVLIEKDGVKLTRGQIASHYGKTEVRKKIMGQIKNKPVLIYLGTSKNKNILKRNHNGKPIVINDFNPKNEDSPNNYFYWVSRRLLSIHEVFGTKTKLGFIDLDLHGTYSLSKAKQYANKLVKVLKSKLNVSPTIYQSGGTGIHIEFKLAKEKDIDALRKELKSLLDEFNKDYPDVSTGIIKGNGMRSDISTLHNKGSLRVAGSLGETYGKEKKPIGAAKNASVKLSWRDIHKEVEPSDLIGDRVDEVLNELNAKLNIILRKNARRRGVREEYIWLYANGRLYVKQNVSNEKEISGVGHAELAQKAEVSPKHEYPRGFITYYDNEKTQIDTYGLPFWDMPTRVQNAVERYFELSPGQYVVGDTLSLPKGTNLYASDSLSKYKSKRKFDETPEPEGKVERGENKHRFVIQRHIAERAHEHFDLRLENDEGSMSSWAIPKHKLPSGKEKFLAVETEKHPVEYNKFHGTIPKGEYGAGEVEIYDGGTYEPIEKSANKMVFKLKGKKEKGTYNLFKTDGKKWMISEHKGDAND